MVPLRDLVPYANSILCISVSFISHRPDRKRRTSKGQELELFIYYLLFIYLLPALQQINKRFLDFPLTSNECLLALIIVIIISNNNNKKGYSPQWHI